MDANLCVLKCLCVDLGTSKSVCWDKKSSYHICYENIGQKQQNTLKSRERQTMDRQN